MDIFTDKEVIKRLRSEGWEEIKGQGKGSYRKFYKEGTGRTIAP